MDVHDDDARVGDRVEEIGPRHDGHRRDARGERAGARVVERHGVAVPVVGADGVEDRLVRAREDDGVRALGERDGPLLRDARVRLRLGPADRLDDMHRAGRVQEVHLAAVVLRGEADGAGRDGGRRIGGVAEHQRARGGADERTATGPPVAGMAWTGTTAFVAAGVRGKLMICVSLTTRTRSPSSATARAVPAYRPMDRRGPSRPAISTCPSCAYARVPSFPTAKADALAGAASVPVTRSLENARIPRAMISLARCGWVHSYGSRCARSSNAVRAW